MCVLVGLCVLKGDFVCLREQMKDNARLVLEENQNLLEQISVKDQKTHDLHQAHLREGTVYHTCPMYLIGLCQM